MVKVLIDEEPMALGEFLTSKYYKAGGWELCRGELVAMSPARAVHEEVVVNLTTMFKTLLGKGRCRVFGSNVGLRLWEDDSWLSPDVSVCCDDSMIKDGWFLKIPELVAEVLSRSTKAYDMVQKREIYKAYGAKEYWMVDIDEQWILVENFALNKKIYYGLGETVSSFLLDGIRFPVSELF
ncbi:MAG: Uma2 family endonuclease [Peptococcaceae bacterium]|nr:Uma2 family endonuclease [Peptococcaceae bacterium]